MTTAYASAVWNNNFILQNDSPDPDVCIRSFSVTLTQQFFLFSFICVIKVHWISVIKKGRVHHFQ